MKRKLVILGIAILISAVIIFVFSPQFRALAVKTYYKGARAVSSTYDSAVDTVRDTYDKVAKTLEKPYQRGKYKVKETLSPSPAPSLPDGCTFKEFADLTPETENYGWAYWYMHTAKQNAILTSGDSCLNDPFKANPSSMIATWNYECFKNRALGNDYCPSYNSAEDSYYDRLSQVEARGQLQTDLNRTIEIPNNYSGWATASCRCVDAYQNICPDDEYTHVENPEYRGDCINKAQLMSLITYNLNKEIKIRITGELTVEDDRKPVSNLGGATIKLEGINQEGLWHQIATTTANYSSLSRKTTYEFILTNPIKQAIESVIDKEFEVWVEKGGFWGYGKEFSINSLNNDVNFELTSIEEYEFSDVRPRSLDWEYWYVASVAQNGIIGGYPDGSFQPTLPIDRTGAAVYIIRAAGIQPCCNNYSGTPCQSCSMTQRFSDVPTDSFEWAYVEAAYQAGIMDDHDGDGDFGVTELITQGQFNQAMKNARGGATTLIPSGYSPAYDANSNITRAQTAALLSWNFNKDLSIKIEGQLSYKDGSDPSSLEGVEIKLFRDDGTYIDKTTAGFDSSGNIVYKMNVTRKIQQAFTTLIGEFFTIKAYKGGMEIGMAYLDNLDRVYQHKNIQIESLPFTLSGKLTVYDNVVPVSELDGAIVKLYFEDGQYIAQTTARYNSSANETRYILTHNNFNGLQGQPVVLHVYKDEFDDAGGRGFIVYCQNMIQDYEVYYDRLMITGDVYSQCGEDYDKKNLVGTAVKLYDNSDSANPVLLKTTQTTLDENKVVFDFELEKLAQDKNFKVVASKEGYYDDVHKITLTPDHYFFDLGMSMKYKTTNITGRVIYKTESKLAQRLKIGLIFEVQLSINQIYFPSAKTDQTGNYIIQNVILPKEFVSVAIRIKPAGLIGKLTAQIPQHDIDIKHCPVSNIRDIIVESSKECRVISDSGTNLRFCAWGEEATNDLVVGSLDDRLTKIVQYISGIRSAVGDNNIFNPLPTNSNYRPGVVNIIDIGGGGYTTYGANSVALDYQRVKSEDLLSLKGTVIHEFGHQYDYYHTSRNVTMYVNWGNAHVAGKDQKKNDDSIWKRLEPVFGNSDYPGTNPDELFAESFATRYMYKDRYKSYTTDTAIPAKSRSFYRFTWDLHGVDWAGDLIKANTDVATRIYEQIVEILSY